MIHGNSTDPVFIKKIFLKVWTLRDEVETIIAKRAEQGLENCPIEDILEEYKFKAQIDSDGPQLTVIDGGHGDDAEASDDNANEDDEHSTPELTTVENNDQESNTEDDGVTIIQRGAHNIPAEKLYRGMTVLTEVTMNTIYFFCSKNFMEGQSIVMEFQVPKRFVVNAEIHYCRPFNIQSRVISSQRLSYRVAARFTFLKPGEKTLLRQFIESVEPEIPEVVEVKKKKVEEDTDDVFGGLDDLDL